MQMNAYINKGYSLTLFLYEDNLFRERDNTVENG